MKTTILFFILLFSFFNSFSQNPEEKNDDFFFRAEVDSLGICYGKSLIQAEWDTIKEEVIIKEESRKLVQIDSFNIDTIYTDYYILNYIENLFSVIDFVDTSNLIIEIRGEGRKLDLPSSYFDNREKIEMTRLEQEGFHTWLSENNDITKSNSWATKFTPPIYSKEIKFVFKTPGTTREIIIPAEYKTIIAIQPKKDITIQQLKILQKVCSKTYTKTIYGNYTKEVLIPKESIFKEKYILIEKAKTDRVIIDCLPPLKDIQKRLFKLKLYNGEINGELNIKTKQAIINYQLKHHLPIGQLDKSTLKSILNK